MTTAPTSAKTTTAAKIAHSRPVGGHPLRRIPALLQVRWKRHFCATYTATPAPRRLVTGTSSGSALVGCGEQDPAVGDLPDDGRYDEYEPEDYERHIQGVTAEYDRLFAENLDAAAEVVRVSLQNEGLQVALGHRGVIGQAMGVLMERFKIKPAEAFDMIRKASQRRNVKLYALAESLARTGEFPPYG